MPNDPRDRLEAMYARWHRPEFLGTDPLVLVREAAPEDREVVGFLVSCLTLGRASLVVRAAKDLLGRLDTPLAPALRTAPPGSWGPRLKGFVYRFFSADRVAALLDATGQVLRRHSTLQAAWLSSQREGWAAVDAFAELFQSEADLGILVPTPGVGAAKRLNLFLRWMVRQDAIDLGLWSRPTPDQLFMPVDTHVLQWARLEGFTSRTTADRRACVEITAALKNLCPEDPLRYDFAITREGMHQKGTLF